MIYEDYVYIRGYYPKYLYTNNSKTTHLNFDLSTAAKLLKIDLDITLREK